MYSSPIEIIYDDLQTKIVQEYETIVMAAVSEVGLTVDKEELIKALQYDSNQYIKGYSEGKSEVLDKIRAEILNFKEKCNASDYLVCGILEIIDKYKAESEG